MQSLMGLAILAGIIYYVSGEIGIWVAGISFFLLIASPFIIFILAFIQGFREPKSRNRVTPVRQPSRARNKLGPKTKESYLPERKKRSKTVKLSVNLRIQYIDWESNKSDREISVHSYTPADGKISAYCHTANAPRTFLVRNILSASDTDTGEIIYDMQEFLKERLI